jgi:hypothetical protein
MAKPQVRITVISLVILTTIATVANTASGSTIVFYSASTGLPAAPWQLINNGPSGETSQHTVFVQSDVLHLIDNALLIGNTLGYLQRALGSGPSHRCRVPLPRPIGTSGPQHRR